MVRDKKSLIDSIYYFGIVSVSLLAFFVYKTLFFFSFFYFEGLESYILLMLTAGVFGFVGIKIKDTDLTCPIFRFFTKMMAIGFVFYLLVEPTTYVSAQEETDLLAKVLRYGDLPAILFALIAIRRPVFLMLPSVHVIAAREMVGNISGVSMSFHDIYYLCDAGFLFAFGIVLLNFLNRKKKYTSEQVKMAYQMMAYVAIGVHLANYFWSGIAKLRLDGGPFGWLLENDISQLFIVALYKGVAFLYAPSQFVQFVYDVLSVGNVFFNGFVLLIQLLSIVFVLRVSWLRASSLIFDFFHVTVYVIAGILFWPWIWMNLTILFAMAKARNEHIYPLSKLVACVTILLGGLNLFHTAFLAWYDVRDSRFVLLQAKTLGSDEWVNVPIAYIGTHAYSFSYGALDRGVRENHFPPNIPGMSYVAEELRANGDCVVPPVDESKVETEDEAKERLERAERFVSAIHKDFLDDMKLYGKYSYYFRLHHHQSNPMVYKEFHGIDPREIEYFKVITRSACLDMVEGRVVDKVVNEDEHIIKVR